MPNTYTLLETITVGAAGASSVTFNSIPQTGYTDLVMKVSTRSSASGGGGSGVWDFATIRFNGSTTGYSERLVYGDGTSAQSLNASSIDFWTDYSAATASTFGSTEIYIPNYTGSNNKSVSIDIVSEHNGTNAFAGLNAGLWSNSAAITSIVLAPGSGSWVQHSTFSLYGVSALGTTPTKAPKATGGSIIQTDGTYWYHAFLSSGTFTPATALSCDVLVVAGGGGGGRGGGGGAGGLLYSASQSIGVSAQTVTIGAGGATSTATNSKGSNGSNSQFGSITASVGGGGGGGFSNLSGNFTSSGGSGGGGGGSDSANDVNASGAGTSGQGNAGGNGVAATTTNAGGGGGGAGAVGSAAIAGAAGAGGAGTNAYSTWLSTTGLGVSGFIAGGGGGVGATTGGAGGSGGGGTGTTYATGTAVSGTANTGSGASGAITGSASGGSGLVIIRYLA
jgi:hypothetical protein